MKGDARSEGSQAREGRSNACRGVDAGLKDKIIGGVHTCEGEATPVLEKGDAAAIK